MFDFLKKCFDFPGNLPSLNLLILRTRAVFDRCGVGIRDQKGGIWDHKPWDWDQRFFEDQGSGCIIFVGSGSKFVTLLVSRIKNLGRKMGSAMKKHSSL